MTRDDRGQCPLLIGTPTDWVNRSLPALDDAKQWEYHKAFTPIHEAGHAIAMRLAGNDIHDIKLASAYGKIDGAWGRVRSVRSYNRNLRLGKELLAEEGRAGIFKGMISALAGPAAEMRLGGQYAGNGMQHDYCAAEKSAVWFQRKVIGLGAEEALHVAWSEASRMVSAPNVWDAIHSVAKQVIQSMDVLDEDKRHSTPGEFVHAAVKRHLPDGWAYQIPDWAA